MRITFVLPHAGMAGGIRVIAIYAQRLQARGHEVTVVSTSWKPPGRRRRALAALRRWMHHLDPRARGPLDPSHFDGTDINHVRIRRRGPLTDADVPDADVVVATWWKTAKWVNDFSPSKGAKAYFVQDYGAHEGQPLDAVVKTWQYPLHKMVISRWLMKLIEEHCGETDADYVPNAVDLDRFFAPLRQRQPRPTVGFLYNPAPQKGCDIILEAIDYARHRIPELQVVAYGPVDPHPNLPLPPGTKYWKFAPDEQLREIYASCDAWLFGSRLEGFGLPILEAMACRTPVIATPAGAAPELVSPGGGMLVKLDDPISMGEAIVRMMKLPESGWRAMSDKAYATVSTYTWDDATDLFEASLIRAIERSKTDALNAA